jgi:hypothetical protein
MIAALLPLLLCVLIIAITVYVAQQEWDDTIGPEGPLQAYCLRLREQSRDDASKLQALLDLELLERNVTVWRLDWIIAVAIAVISSVGACCSGGGAQQMAVVFIIAYLSGMMALRLHRSYYSAHIIKHPSDMRMRFIKDMLGLKDTSGYYYGTPA